MEKTVKSNIPDPPEWWNSLTPEEQEKYTCVPASWKYRHLSLENLEEEYRRIMEEDAKLTEWPPVD